MHQILELELCSRHYSCIFRILILAKDFVKCAFGHFSIAIGKLKTVDDAFRHQLESKEMKHREDMAELEEERQIELERANQRVRQSIQRQMELE